MSSSPAADNTPASVAEPAVPATAVADTTPDPVALEADEGDSAYDSNS